MRSSFPSTCIIINNNDAATTANYTPSLHDALPISNHSSDQHEWFKRAIAEGPGSPLRERYYFRPGKGENGEDRKSTRLNSSHVKISSAVFCLIKKKYTNTY